MANIDDSTLLANHRRREAKSGSAVLSTTTATRHYQPFWLESQNKSLMFSAGEAYNVEHGISNGAVTKIGRCRVRTSWEADFRQLLNLAVSAYPRTTHSDGTRLHVTSDVGLSLSSCSSWTSDTLHDLPGRATSIANAASCLAPKAARLPYAVAHYSAL